MLFDDYKINENLDEPQKQHNILVFVGNGFDISVLKKTNKKGKTTTYSQFFHYLCYVNCREDNLIFSKMREAKENERDNWSDFEILLSEIVEENDNKSVEDDLEEIQNYFVLFLNDVVTPELLIEIDKKAKENEFCKKSLEGFLSDLCEEDYRRLSFPEKMYHHQFFNYVFINLNYTSVFDNYIFADKKQLDPHPHRTIDTNFKFYPNPRGYKYEKGHFRNGDTVYSSYVLTNVIHPHGTQNIPRSILFGTGIEEMEEDPNDAKKYLRKSMFGQFRRKYDDIDKAELFIIFGTSLGETDNWWWGRIYESLSKEKSELIIYQYSENNDEKKDNVINHFIKACRKENVDEVEKEAVCKRIFVVLFNNESDHILFNYSKE